MQIDAYFADILNFHQLKWEQILGENFIIVLSYPHAIENMLYKTGVINDPLSQTHSHDSSEHYFLLFCLSRLEKWGHTYGRTDNMCENNDPYRPWLWVGRVDQFYDAYWNCTKKYCIAALGRFYLLEYHVIIFWIIFTTSGQKREKIRLVLEY